jgi:hypothetical protein
LLPLPAVYHVGYLDAYLGRLERWLLEVFHQRLKEHCCVLCEDRETHPKTQSSTIFRCANTIGRNSTVSWGDPWYSAYLVGARQQLWERRQLKDSVCLAPFLTEEAACLSEMVFYSTSTSSVL